ncbi:MAG: hypothetical protein FWE19_09685 [Oscillospiraceae bacterium]|nr:hypothetical protein [Oscillospiraceae bacterium]
MQDFDKAFNEFLGREECHKVADALYIVMRSAFMAGWLSAGGKEPPVRQENIEKLLWR